MRDKKKAGLTTVEKLPNSCSAILPFQSSDYERKSYLFASVLYHSSRCLIKLSISRSTNGIFDLLLREELTGGRDRCLWCGSRGMMACIGLS